MTIKAIKIPYGLPTAIVADRVKSDKGYNVNRVIRAVDFYICLKSESHKIHNYTRQLPYLLELCKISARTFADRLKAARELGLINIEGRHLVLSTWEKLRQLFLLKSDGHYTINYDLTNKHQNVQYILKALEIEENRQRQSYAIAKRLAAHPEFEAAFAQFYHSKGVSANFNLKDFTEAKKWAFAEGTDSSLYDMLHSFNPSTERNINTIAQAHGLKHWQGAAYLKYQLVLRGLAEIRRSTPTICHYKNNKKVDKKKLGATKYGRFYNNKFKTVLWHQPDEIVLNSVLFSPPNKAQNLQQPPENRAA